MGVKDGDSGCSIVVIQFRNSRPRVIEMMFGHSFLKLNDGETIYIRSNDDHFAYCPTASSPKLILKQASMLLGSLPKILPNRSLETPVSPLFIASYVFAHCLRNSSPPHGELLL